MWSGEYLCDWLDFWVWKALGVGGLTGGDWTDSFVLFSFVFSNAIGMILSLVDAFALVSGSKEEALETMFLTYCSQKIHFNS